MKRSITNQVSYIVRWWGVREDSTWLIQSSAEFRPVRRTCQPNTRMWRIGFLSVIVRRREKRRLTIVRFAFWSWALRIRWSTTWMGWVQASRKSELHLLFWSGQTHQEAVRVGRGRPRDCSNSQPASIPGQSAGETPPEDQRMPGSHRGSKLDRGDPPGVGPRDGAPLQVQAVW